MIYNIVSIRDRAVDAFGVPVFVANIGGAVRSFGDEIKKEGNPLSAHPEDYDLYHLGTFDDASGMFTMLERPKQIAVGKDYKV